MAGIFPWSTTPGSNTTVDGINIDEGCPPGNVNNAVRSIMALVRATFSSGLETFLAGSAALPIANGGTGAITDSLARAALSAAKSGANSDITSITALTTALAVAMGGTGATTAPAALSALGIAYTTGVNGQCVSIPISGATILVQWGEQMSGANGYSSSYTFPVAFTDASKSKILVAKQPTDSTAVDGNAASGYLVSASQFQIGCDDAAKMCSWLAIGV